MASRIYGITDPAFMRIPEDELTQEQSGWRRTGKNGVLACGYQISADTFYRRYCYHLGKEGQALGAKIVGIYRHSWAPAVPALWRDLAKTARRAMLRPGAIVTPNCGISYWLTSRGGLPCLVCELLNGKHLHYVNARIIGHDTWNRPKWTYWAYRKAQWREIEPYGGQLTEHVVSGMSRELLVDRMFALEEEDYPIVLTVHDEIVAEQAGIIKEAIEAIMRIRPRWAGAEGLDVPVAAKAWVGPRYKK
jgi:DNA polymerase